MIVVATFAEARRARRGRVGLVPTMGFLHEGHLACAAAIRPACDTLMMSIFVNPLQFDRPADLERYPRDLERDVELARRAGVDVVFAPASAEMYPRTPLTRVRVAEVSEGMEGARRPGHFEGVATVVTKLFAGLRSEVAAFGKKDAQQLAVVRRLVADLSFPVEIVGVPTVREPDGLALSSRNLFIEDRQAALGLSRGLFAAADAAAAGERSAAALESLAGEAVAVAGAVVEYATLADAATARPIDRLDRTAFLAVAATVGPVRLIDNIVLEPDGSSDRGSRLEGPSMMGGA
ncbi:MAG: pantoate--beta-alanine ligase [Acidimicrobiia bacterium]|nr:MAG: pantoate--beta-alanine ligase [Acidimicrobiia bacterium]